MFTLLAEVGEGIVLTPEAASLAPADLKLELREDGSARLIGKEDAGASAESALCIGRDAELAAIDAHLDEGGRRVVIEGPPGSGKSTVLRASMARRASGRSVLVEARHHGHEPLGALTAALAIEPPTSEHIDVAIDARRVAVIDALGALLSELDDGALVLFVDDADRLDGAASALLDDLPFVFEGRPLAVVSSERASPAARVSEAPTSAADVLLSDALRGEGRSALGRDARIVLGPLSIPVVRALLTARYGAMIDGRRIGEIAERAGGNPLFAEQLARASKHGGGSLGLPLTIESAVQAQLDHLAPELAQAVYSLSVVGFEGDATSVRAALGAQAGGWMAALEDRGVIRRVDHGFRFRYRVAQEVAYAAIDEAERVRLHRELARRLARVIDEAPRAGGHGLSPDRVLEHAERGGDEALAGRFALEAFFHAAEVGDGPRALALVERARRSTDTPFRCLFLAAQAAAFVRSGESEPLLTAARDAARTPHERALCLTELAEHRRRAGDRDGAQMLLDEVGALLSGDETSEVAARARCRAALLAIGRGSMERAREALAIPSLASLPDAVAALVWDTRGYLAGATGDLGARLAAYERAAELYAACGDVRRNAGASANLGDTQHTIGDDDAAERTLRRAIDGARKVGNTLTEAYALTNLGAVLRRRGRLREAAATLETAAARASAVGDARLSRMIALHTARARGRDVDDATLAATEDDPTLFATALTLRLTHGTPSADVLDAAAALLASSDVEQGVLELGAALFARRPDPAVRAAIEAQMARAVLTLGEGERAAYARTARATLGAGFD